MTVATILNLLPLVAVIGFTALLLSIWQRPKPPPGPEADALARSVSRNGWIDDVYALLGVGAFALPLILFRPDLDRAGWPAIGIAFGGAVIFPGLWVCLVTLPSGVARCREFWVYHAHRYRVSLRTLATVYGLLAFAGVVSVGALFVRGVW